MASSHSIFVKLNLFFIFTVIALIAFFYMTIREFEAQELHLIEKKVLHDEAEIRRIILEEEGDLRKRFKKEGYRIIDDPSFIKSEIKQIYRHPPSSFPLIVSERIMDGRLKIYRDKDNLYFELIGPQHSTMIASPVKTYQPKWIPLLFGSMMAILVLLYWTILRSLKPLKTLAEQIRLFGEGNMNISTRSEKKDEIAFVANQFDAAVKKMKAMKEARTLFMRNIMHELKTPITKGKLSVALMGEGEEEKILKQAFDRMEQLIQEMAQIEKITSQSFKLNIETCDFQKIIDEVAALLFIDRKKHIKLLCRSCKLRADCKMMTIVLKNLIDNAMKYSPDKQVNLCCKKGEIIIINHGEPLSRDFEEIMEPFAKGDSGNSNESFGLGLYIVKSILDAHGAELTHRYEDNVHIFTIKGLKTVR
ncbi:ArsS family sensor histidine kinase [Hydrogenimonas sp.]